MLDLAFVEEEQISVRGRRGGGRSRADSGRNAFESCKNLLFAPEDQNSGASHSRVIETSRYQRPPEAILLRDRVFRATKPFVIRNRVLGEIESSRPEGDHGQQLAADFALVNYAYPSPFLNGDFGSGRISARVGPVARALDFSEQGECGFERPLRQRTKYFCGVDIFHCAARRG